MNNQQYELKIKSFTPTDDDQGIFEAYANTKWFKDHAGDVSVDGCFAQTIAKMNETQRMPKMLFNHKSDEVIGVWLSMVEDEHGLKVTGQLAMKTRKGREIFELLKMGALDALSIGYRVNSEQYDAKTNTNYLLELDIREISVVTFPCNEQSLVSTVKSEIENEPEEVAHVVEEVEVIEEIKSEEIEDSADLNKPDEEEIEINQKLDEFLLNVKLDRFLADYRKKKA